MYLRGVLSASNKMTLSKRALSMSPRWSPRKVAVSPYEKDRCCFRGLTAHDNKCGSIHPLRRHFATSNNKGKLQELPVKILWGSQGGTARIFAMQLSEALESVAPDKEVTIQGLHEESPANLFQPGRNLHIFISSTSGVGQPPDNARDFYDWLTTQADQQDASTRLEGVDFCVFGLGNQKAHPNHYNVIGKGIDEKLAKLGANRILELGLGDDGDCLEDDYDSWMEAFLQSVYHDNNSDEDKDREVTDEASLTTKDAQLQTASTATVDDPTVTLEPCVGVKVGSGGKRLISSKYARLRLTPSDTDVVRDDLLQLESSFYLGNTKSLPVISNRPLNPNAGENGLFELRVSLQNSNLQYETGDHLMVYPQNSQAIVEGVLHFLDVDPHILIEDATEPLEDDSKKRHAYPHPTGITLTESLRHCVDLSAVPSPSVARLLLGRSTIDYKNEIAVPRRTILDLMADAPRRFALEEILYNLPPMKPRYYSIASSAIVHPDEVYLVYRPIQYTSTKGHLRLGVCTSYMKNMMGTNDIGLDEYQTGTLTSSRLIATVNSNPTFRLPSERNTPVLLIAGGCGIAPIRAFLEERIHTADGPFGEGYLFLGFRSPQDAPYKSLVQEASQCGAISSVHITYNGGCGGGVNDKLFDSTDIRAHTSCGLVSDALGEHGEELYSFFERGGHTYVCGGARLFGVAVENQVHLLLQAQGGLSDIEATEYLQKLLAEGRFNEDLSD